MQTFKCIFQFSLISLCLSYTVHKLSVNVLFHGVHLSFELCVFWDKLNSIQNVRGWGWFGYGFITLSDPDRIIKFQYPHNTGPQLVAVIAVKLLLL